MTPERLRDTLLKQYGGLVVIQAWGETGLFYNPG